MTKQVQEEVKFLINKRKLDCSIDEFKNKVNWDTLSRYEQVSENFIREFQDYINWKFISGSHRFSINLLREFKDKVNWSEITRQDLNKKTIEEFKDKVDWNWICQFRVCDEDFIRKYRNNVNWNYIAEYQKLSETFIKEFKLKIPETNWFYKNVEDKLEYLKRHKLNKKYEINEDYLIAYKPVDKNYCSYFLPGYRYEVGKTYKTNQGKHNDQWFHAFNKKDALRFRGNGKIIIVKIFIKDLASFIKDLKPHDTIRCEKIIVKSLDIH